jgi:hypothetical protein
VKVNSNFDICHICGTYGKLSFEHVPPRAAFNDRRILHVAFEEIIATETLIELPESFNSEEPVLTPYADHADPATTIRAVGMVMRSLAKRIRPCGSSLILAAALLCDTPSTCFLFVF